ncbi:TTF-type domain-containing protein [Trichonephila clavipes]|nr:TTF-type domain-containing protein [Trichonephila clavipes]
MIRKLHLVMTTIACEHEIDAQKFTEFCLAPDKLYLALYSSVLHASEPPQSADTKKASKNSGNIIDLFKLISKYNPTLREHINRINNKQLAHHYVSHDIQSEFIPIQSNIVTSEMIDRIKEAKYSFLRDCTTDSSRIEQMLVILRYCNTSTENIEENLIRFLAVTETTGECLTNAILGELEKMP